MVLNPTLLNSPLRANDRLPCSVACFSASGRSGMITPLPRKCDKIQVPMIANSAMSATTMMPVRTTLMTGPPRLLVVPALGVDLPRPLLLAGRRHIVWRDQQWSLRLPLPWELIDVAGDYGVLAEVGVPARWNQRRRS